MLAWSSNRKQGIGNREQRTETAGDLSASSAFSVPYSLFPIPYDGMKLLLTNDDGIDAPDWRRCASPRPRWARSWWLRRPRLSPVAVIASPRISPSTSTSCAPVVWPWTARRRICVRVGLHTLAPDAAWVLSGINAGGNLGADVYHSGTVAAVREAVLHGRPGIALSHYHKKGWPIDWALAVSRVTPLLRCLLEHPHEPGVFWNVNLPHREPGAPEPDVSFCPLDPEPLPLSFRSEGQRLHYDGDYHGRRRKRGADVDVCFGGASPSRNLPCSDLPTVPICQASGVA